jgi:hypothetical protein
MIDMEIIQVMESSDTVERRIKDLRNLAKDCDIRKDDAIYSMSRRLKSDATLPYLAIEDEFVKMMELQAKVFRAKADDLEVDLTRLQRKR